MSDGATPPATGRTARLTEARRVLALLAVAGLAALLLVAAPQAAAAPGDPQPSDPAPTSTSSEPPAPTGTSSEPPAPTGTSSEPPAPTTPAPSEPPAEPPPFSDQIDAASPGQEALAADATRLSRLVFETEEQLSRLELEGEAVAETYRQAEADLAEASTRADRTRLAAVQAELDLRIAQAELESFARDSYVNNNSQFASAALLLDSNGPRDLIDRAGLLELIAQSRSQVLDQVMAVLARSAAADDAAAAAFGSVLETEATARASLDESTALLETQQAALPTLLAQKADYEATFYAALVQLLGPQGAAAAFADYERDQAAQYSAEAAARAAAYAGGPVLSGRWALPVQGTFTSCFCERWGTMHWGIDIAAPMYTPEYSAGDGVVIQAGQATGFGQAVYIQHDNGDVTVYGHMEVIEVTAGQRVSAGQEIALLGSQGFSTGPHLHFEVHLGGINGVRVDPVPWLAQRGIFV